MTQPEFKFFAFISYSSKDTCWGKRLQKKLENYRMPATLCQERGWKRKPMEPIFFAPTDIQPGGLTEEIRERLRASRYLIVICSPNSAKSEWVGKEIELFHNLGRTKNIHFFIVEGTPHSGNPDTECFNPVINQLGLPEILGANIHEKIYRWPWLNKERAYVQLISKLLGVEFDSIWQRHKRMLTRKIAAWAVGIVAVICALFGVWRANQPENIVVRLNEASVHNDQLPPLRNAIVTMTLKNEIKSDTIREIDNHLTFRNIPHHFLKKPVHVTITCTNFHDVDTIVCLSKQISLNIYRNPQVFGDVHFTLHDIEAEKSIPHSRLEIDGHETFSDEKGNVSLFIPLESQKTTYSVSTSFPLEDSIIHMPSGPNDVLLIKH